jgi:hypothetical protein
MISLDNARKWSKEAAIRRTQKELEKWVVRIGDGWVQTFRDKMTQAMVDAVRQGKFQAQVTISSPDYRSYEQRDKWQEFIRPDLEKLLQEYEEQGFEDGASESSSTERNTIMRGAYFVTVEWGFRRRRPGVERVRYD